jgi:alpha-tubulin suppressor-like RCC1 family protein
MIISRRAVLGLMPLMPAVVRAAAQGSAPARARRIVEAVGGYYMIEPEGRVRVWTTGPNTNGTTLLLDDDRIVPPYVAHELTALKGAITISGHGEGTFAVMADGRVLAWGSNANGMLGITSRAELEATARPRAPGPMPTATLTMPRIVDVAAGAKHVLALAADGTVYTWGNGQLGQLGIGALPVINFKTRTPEPMPYVPFPMQVPGLDVVTAIAAANNFSLALRTDGTVQAWGDNVYGQLGDGTLETRTRPVTVNGIRNALAVAAGLDFTAALLTDGTVMTWGWGNGAFGRPGLARHGANPTPMLVPGVSGATAIAAGGQHMLALTTGRKVLSWGEVNVYDPVGRSGTPVTPGVVPLISGARAVFAGSLSSQALLEDGTFMAWGFLPSLWFRVDGAGSEGSRFPIPLVVKGL